MKREFVRESRLHNSQISLVSNIFKYLWLSSEYLMHIQGYYTVVLLPRNPVTRADFRFFTHFKTTLSCFVYNSVSNLYQLLSLYNIVFLIDSQVP